MKALLIAAAVLAIAAVAVFAYYVGVIVGAAGNTLELVQGAM
ncbi:hypothetical protein V1638_04285 [Pseudarthrobacter sp. J64]|nr:hypothetical protein [Pseudarthrobacter sp. J64]MEE2568615.1 hypothetical protein [Pseudarthrobacter sp. J64]